MIGLESSGAPFSGANAGSMSDADAEPTAVRRTLAEVSDGKRLGRKAKGGLLQPVDIWSCPAGHRRAFADRPSTSLAVCGVPACLMNPTYVDRQARLAAHRSSQPADECTPSWLHREPRRMPAEAGAGGRCRRARVTCRRRTSACQCTRPRAAPCCNDIPTACVRVKRAP